MKGACALKSIQIQNVRCLKDTGNVSLAPITLLVGENSAGKSTFLRTFPLFKQSIRKRTDGPILWAGDVDDYVDFGSFEETVTDDDSQANAKSITFQFQFSMPPIHYEDGSLLRTTLQDKNAKFSILYSMTVSHRRSGEYVSNVKIRLGQTEFDFDLTPGHGISIDGEAFLEAKIRPQTFQNYDRLLNDRLLTARESIFDFSLPWVDNVIKRVSDIFPKDGKNEQYDDWKIAESMGLSGLRTVKQVLRTQVGECLCYGFSLSEVSDTLTEDFWGYAVLKPLLCNLENSTDERKEILIKAFKLISLYEYFQPIDAYIGSYFRRVHYIAPLRATAERYYRLRNLSIDEVDYQGSNLAMFLDGLRRKRRLSEFQKWTDAHFGFHVRLATKGVHLSVEIALRDSKHFSNLSDTGFGYSQILPIITQLWYLSSKKSSADMYRNQEIPLVIAIEQPELHLHPALQAKLADAFLASIQLAKESGIYLQLILETHSATIVNYFGRAIAEKRLQKDDVSLVLFIRSLETRETEVRTSSYDEDGYLTNWPVGFLAPGR